MQVFELSVKVYLLKNILENEILSQEGFLIDLVLGKSENFLELHKKNCFKNYCFNGFYPLENDKVYKEDNIYTFQIRTVSKELAIYLAEELPKNYTNYLKVLKVDEKIIKKKNISKIYSITPIILKNEVGYWRGNYSLEYFENRVKSNLIKKYNNYTGEKIEEDFPLFIAMEFKNRKPVAINYKGRKLLGDKVSYNIADDEKSQELAYFALGVGVGEFNPRGAGYMNFRYL
ncbi:CRISPR-associated endoribonuclease Cas6 [Clostridium moniliforme]|uniref:CRISPR-associated endoribonuclease Cas6 n=1 Tax=Clostridium moniliforme TaxID=39489 RepID=A0ABS4EXS3_9CLOT|nr:CRISPR-associated endoribonuclease Cas6 [Clostridium moniliforme]MBP1888795.1 CRISPR-associated endoribonuclease Cas6 [Clostridium moniliforme]